MKTILRIKLEKQKHVRLLFIVFILQIPNT